MPFALLTEGLAIGRPDTVAVMDADGGDRRPDTVPLGGHTGFNGGVDRGIDGGLCLGIGLRDEDGHGKLRLRLRVIGGGLRLKNIGVGEADFSDGDGGRIHLCVPP